MQYTFPDMPKTRQNMSTDAIGHNAKVSKKTIIRKRLRSFMKQKIYKICFLALSLHCKFRMSNE